MRIKPKVLLPFLVAVAVVSVSDIARAQTVKPSESPSQAINQAVLGDTTQDYNRRLQQLDQLESERGLAAQPGEYRIGPEDLLEISVFEDAELNRTVRVAADGKISLPLLGPIRAAGLTARETELVIEELLRRTYVLDPHVSVFVKEMQSHAVSVFGAVKKPGVYQIRGPKSVIELLSMAEGLADDAGDSVLVVRHNAASTIHHPIDTALSENALPAKTDVASPPSTTVRADGAPSTTPSEDQTDTIDLKSLLESGDPRLNVLVYPGDVVKVTSAGIVYVVGEVKQPGGFQLKSNENVTVLQALALAGGLTRTSSADQSRIIRTNEVTGARTATPLELNKVLAGQIPDPALGPRDILFIPNSAARSALFRGLEAAVSIGTGVAIYRR